MDNNETNKLSEGTGLEESLTEAVNVTAEQSEPEQKTDVPESPIVDTAPADKPAESVVETETPAVKKKRTVKPKVQPVDVTIQPEPEKTAEEPKKKRTVRKKTETTEEPTPVIVDENPIKYITHDEASILPADHEIETGLPTPVTKLEVIDQLKELITKSDNDIKERIDFLKQTFYRIHKAELEKPAEETDTEAALQVIDPLETELKELLNNWREKRAEHIAEQEKQRQQNLEKKLQIIEAIRSLTESTEDIGRTLPEFRRLQQVWKETGNIPQEQINELWKKYQMQVERFYDLLKINNEFREYDFKKNLEIKTTLCENAEKLAEEPDVVVAFHQLQKLHEEWRETGPVARDFREDIWNRFKNASTIINKNHQHFFERLKSAETENLAQKTVICEQVEAIDFTQLKSYKDWDAKTAEIIQLQEQWKAIGFAPKKINNKVFERFRSACDTFFRQKSDFYKAAKDILNQNLEKKKLLCEKAEALKESTDWKTTSDILIRIQKEWKSIGPVPKKISDSIWKRFISACDYFFEQKEKFAPAQKNEEARNLETKKELIAQLESIPTDIPEEEAVKLYRELVTKWNAIGHVPFKEKDAVYKSWHDALDKLTDRLNISKENRRLNKFQHNLDDMSNKGQGKVLHERERLLRQFDSLSTEIKTAENNIGFFTMSKSSGEGLLKEITQKIEALKEERDLIYKKIKMIDEQL